MSVVDWQRTTLVGIAPDAIAKHVAAPLLGAILDEGFEPIRYRLIDPGPEQIDELYRTNIEEAWETYRYRALDRLFEFGPTLLVLLRDVSGRAPGETHAHMHRLKGSGDLHEVPPDTLRRRFGAVNIMLSLMHSSASPEDAEVETGIMFGRSLLAGDPDELDAPVDQPHVLEFARFVQSGYPRETRDFEDCLSGLRARLVSALWELLTPEGRQLAVRLEDEGALAAAGAGARIGEHLRPGCEPALVAALECDFVPGTIPMPPERIWRLLAGYGVQVDRWEELVLGSSAYFRPFRKHELAAPPETEQARYSA